MTKTVGERIASEILQLPHVQRTFAEAIDNVIAEALAKEREWGSDIMTELLACVHTPNPTDKHMWHVKPGHVKRFSKAIEYLAAYIPPSYAHGRRGVMSEKMIVLKPCPFCGGKAEMSGNTSAQSIKRYREKRYWVICKRKCQGSGYGRATKANAAKGWNKRI